ncbi:MAG: hypothetical protein II840_01950 [Kiritimatiellae bacterium]|nr:hypothetical protein [Kiritimatiellia bacterium]
MNSKSMNRKSCLFARCAAICLIVVQVAATASARTVYDAGKALRQNFQNNATPANPYTDENGGMWYYSSAAGVAPYTSLGNFASSYAKIDNDQLQGWGGTSSPHLKVNITGQTLASSSFMVGDCEPIEADEMVFHPGQSGNSCMVLRFVVPEAGWYSAFASFHDTSAEATPTASSGASVYVGVGANDVFASGIVSLEGVAGSTKRFDFQMPARYLAKDTEIRFSVNNNKGSSGTAHASDATGVKVFVVKEDEGAFYDSGLAMGNNVAASPYANPYGTIADGTWYFLTAAAPAAQTAPANVSLVATSRITTEATSSTYLKGVANAANGQSPFVLVNTASSAQSTAVAPGELKVHPKAGDSTLKTWTVVRFRPPQSGYYSASIVARDVDRADLTQYSTADGVDVYLYIADTLVTNAYVSLETAVACTAHFTFKDRFLVAGEPVDIVVSPHGEVHSDATGVSAIFRREPGTVYDAGISYYEEHKSGNCSNYFSDNHDADAKWLMAMKSTWSEAHSPLATYLNPEGNWWTHATDNQNNGTEPRVTMAANGVAYAGAPYLNSGAPLLSAAPQEILLFPKNPVQDGNYCAALKAAVPSDGIYRVRSYARDLNGNTTNGDGVRVMVSVSGHAPASAIVSRDGGNYPYEAALSADRLWMKQGDALFFTVDPIGNSTSDVTAVSACYERVGDATAHVVNIDFGVPSKVVGKFSDHTGAGREGWSDWNTWNALRISNSSPSATVSVENCREADGETKRNVTLTLTRSTGTAKKGYTSGGSALHNNWAESDSASDTYTFTLSKLKKNAAYTLYLYSAKGGAAGNASFTVGGVAKTPDETWNLRDTKVLARFDVESDANGQITGTFAAADSNGGAFNGLTLVGEFPEYDPPGMIIFLR